MQVYFSQALLDTFPKITDYKRERKPYEPSLSRIIKSEEQKEATKRRLTKWCEQRGISYELCMKSGAQPWRYKVEPDRKSAKELNEWMKVWAVRYGG